MVIPSTVVARAAVQLSDLVLCFRVSADEEHVEIDAVHLGGTLPIPVRVHHYMLLTLARARLHDRAHGSGPAEEGWEEIIRLV